MTLEQTNKRRTNGVFFFKYYYRHLLNRVLASFVVFTHSFHGIFKARSLPR